MAWPDGSVIRNVLVEVFPAKSQEHDTASEKRLAACVTGENGRFEFKLRPGQYEVRFSLDKGVNVTVMRVTVAAKAQLRTLQVTMSLGT